MPSSPRVLIVEDNRVVREETGRWLTEGGLIWIDAADVPTALARLHDWTIDAVLLDLSLPNGGAGRLLGALRSDPVRYRLPVVGVTRDGVPDPYNARMLGCATTLDAPFERPDLLAALNLALESRAA